MKQKRHSRRSLTKQENNLLASRIPIPYTMTGSGIYWNKRTKDGTVQVPLTNFPAKIIGDVVEDDGVETLRFLEIEATVAGRTQSFTIPAQQFYAMNWATEFLGPRAIIYSGFGAKDQARVAIQVLSTTIQSNQIYTHTGWRQLEDNQWVYLHAGGAVGAHGAVSAVGVKLDAALSRYHLPGPSEGAELDDAIKASLMFLDCAPDRITVPLFAAVYRAALGPASFSLHLSGRTGTMKTTIAALAQQHFGKDLDASHLPGSWTSTANALEGLCFTAKDSVVTVDDFCPIGNQTDQQRLHGQADRLFRAQGNQSGRSRMRQDASLRPPKPPRGLIISTGEDTPKGHSLRARLLVLELAPEDVQVNRVTDCQQAASTGQYALAMAGYVKRVAIQYEDIKAELSVKVAVFRAEAAGAQFHKRTPEIIAHLAVGIHYFLQYAFERRVITQEELNAYWERCWQALIHVSQAQVDVQCAQQPVARFVDLLAAALASGKAHLASMEGYEPSNPQAAGWKRVALETDDYLARYQSQGSRIGWTDEDEVYLQPDTAFTVAQQMAREMGDPITVSAQTLRKRMKDEGVLRIDEGRRHRFTIRKNIEGKRHEVLCLPLNTSPSNVHPVHLLYQPRTEGLAYETEEL